MRLLLVAAALAATNTLTNRLPEVWYVPLCVVVSALLLALARWDGISWSDLGLGRDTVRRGLRWCELRRRSGSLIAPASLHCALNGAGYVLAWLAAT
ncbi:hypothetical protein [Streptomyces sp. NPDC051776]|uniref:hypothetical protein n=1 Tax=Streptomyces sp. NPDC051776 TaxID=3155414 RepID=UPI00342B9120